MAISVEDDLDILHRRLHQAQRHISEEIVSKMEYKVGSYQGKVSLTEFQKGKSVPTEFYDVFSDHVQEYNPDVLILDTLARFIEGDENNNNLMNGMFELMELLGKRISCNVILVHHSAKRAGDVIKKQKDLDTSLSQTSVRGASSMAGALRWILQLVPIGASMVKDLLGDGEPPQGEDGTHVLAKVVKKNEGPPESFIILEKGAGKLSRLHSQAESFKEDQIENMVQKLVEEIEALAKDGTEVPASYPENVLQWSKTFLHEAVNRAIERGLITKVHNVGKNGYHLEVVK
jgi:RecA-family ATPase